MKNILLFILILLSLQSSCLFGQHNKRANIWYFGYNAGLNFNIYTPAPLKDGLINVWEGCSVICDKSGNLIFYSDGINIWNKRHMLIPKATNLGGNYSSSQSGIIVPQPENPNIYFVFSVDAEGGSGGIQYSVVDLRLNNGLGGIVSKNNHLLTRASEKLTVIKHYNNKDYWILTHELENNSFRAFQITNKGLLSSSVVSSEGSIHYGSTGAIGYMKVSPDGEKIALGIYGNNLFEIFRFNNQSGIVYNPILLNHADFKNAYGVEFSPNSKLLYTSGTQTYSGKIYQFDLTNYNLKSILDSKISIGETPTSTSYFGALQLGPDRKIYIAIDKYKYLGVIHNPDQKGIGSQFVANGIFLAGRLSGLGLPNLIPSYLSPSKSAKATDSKHNTLLNTESNEAPLNPLFTITGKVFDKRTANPVKTTIYFVDHKFPMNIIYTTNDGTYKFKTSLSKLDIEIIDSNYEFFQESITVDKNVLLKDIYLVSKNSKPSPKSKPLTVVPTIVVNGQTLKKGESIVLNSIQFKQSESKLLPEAKVELDNIIKLLNQYPLLRVELSGHTSNEDERERRNLKLSEQRVVACKQYIVAKLNDTIDRITTVGYGSTRPRVLGDTEDKRRQNRRVELTIVSF